MPYKDKTKHNAYMLQWISQRRCNWFAANGPCVECGSVENLELDHIDPNKKVSHRIWSWSKKRRDEEIAKCQVLCRSCHTHKTYRDYYELLPKHGTTGYRHGCRCDVCRKANTLARREYRRKHRVGSDNGSTSVLHAESLGSIPSRSTKD